MTVPLPFQGAGPSRLRLLRIRTSEDPKQDAMHDRALTHSSHALEAISQVGSACSDRPRRPADPDAAQGGQPRPKIAPRSFDGGRPSPLLDIDNDIY